MAIIKNPQTINTAEGVERREPSYSVGGNVNWLQPLWRIVCACVLSCFSHVQFFQSPWTVASQAPPSMGFSRQEYWSGLQFPSPGNLPDPGIEPVSVMSPALAGRFLYTNIP